MTTTAPEQVVQVSATTSIGTTAFVTTADIPVGRVIVIAMDRSATSGTTNGGDAITTSAGAVSGYRCLGSACRASTHDLGLYAVEVTTLIPSGSTITFDHKTNAAGKRGAVLSVWPNVALPPVEDATSGTASQGTLGNVANGANGSGTTATASTSASMPAGDHLVLGAVSTGGTVNTTAGSGYTEVGSIKTASGSGDRGVLLEYQVDNTSGVKTATGTYASTSGWAAAVATLPLIEEATGRVDEFTANSGSATSLVIPVDAAVPVGRLVVVSFAALLATGTYTIADSRGNTYTVDDGPADFGLGAAFGYARQGQSKLTTALQSGDSITISVTGGTPSRWAAIAGVFATPVNAVLGDVSANETDTLVGHGISGLDVVRDDNLVVVSHYMVNSGRVATAENSWNLSDKVVSAVGTSDRGIIQAWKYLPGSASYSEWILSYNSSGSSGHLARAFEIPAPDLIFKRWTGTVWETVTPKRQTGSAWETVTSKEL